MKKSQLSLLWAFLFLSASCNFQTELPANKEVMLRIENNIVVNEEGKVLFDGSRFEGGLILGDKNGKGDCFISSVSEYEGTNAVFVTSTSDGTILHKLRFKGWYIDGGEPPKWIEDDSAIVVAVLGDPKNDDIDHGRQTFYLWKVSEKKLFRLGGLGANYHGKFYVDGDNLHYISTDNVSASVSLDPILELSPSDRDYEAF